MLAWVTAGLTFALLGITAFYAWSNYRVMHVMETDFKARNQPIPRLGINFSHDPRPGDMGTINSIPRCRNRLDRLLHDRLAEGCAIASNNFWDGLLSSLGVGFE